MIKINMGCGWRDFGEDWIHIDGGDYDHLDYNDITKLQFDDNSVDLIYASHVIEYFNRHEVIGLLLEWRRVLKPNGVLRLAVPNFKAISSLYQSSKYNLEDFLGPIFGQMKMGEETIYHKTTYDYESLRKILLQWGFHNVNRWDWRNVDHGVYDDHSQAYLPRMDKENGTLISLNLQANKYIGE